MVDILITIILAVCIGFFVAIFISFVWTCVALIAKAIAKEPATANVDKHIIWMGILAAVVIFLLSILN